VTFGSGAYRESPITSLLEIAAHPALLVKITEAMLRLATSARFHRDPKGLSSATRHGVLVGGALPFYAMN
jgi:hypothetical protein